MSLLILLRLFPFFIRFSSSSFSTSLPEQLCVRGLKEIMGFVSIYWYCYQILMRFVQVKPVRGSF
jgi:hypothetical protein